MKIRSWKEIAGALDCSIRKAQLLAYRPKSGRLPLPVERDAIGIFLDTGKLERWSVEEAEPALAQLNRDREPSVALHSSAA